jgi:hypothetical protein
VKRTLISLLISTAMVIGPLPAMSADTGPLPSGAAAGVKQAQGKDDDETPLLWLVGAGVVIGLGILILSNNNNNSAAAVSPAVTTTTTTAAKAVTTTTTTNP